MVANFSDILLDVFKSYMNIQSKSYQFILLFCWIFVGTVLRFNNLNSLPPWTDECATMTFSLGNTFKNVPLDRFIDLNTLLAPFIPRVDANVRDVVDRLLSESTHPPAHFILTHLWLKLFPTEDGLVSLSAARSFSVILGIMAIPAMFWLGWVAFNSLLVSQMTAAIVAFSPFAIFLNQQARQYSLVILCVIVSLGCFVKALKAIARSQSIPLWLILIWIAVNSLGVATHYFFVLTLAAEALVILKQAWKQFRRDRHLLWRLRSLDGVQSPWWGIYTVGLGSLVGCSVWLSAVLAVKGKSPTDWVYETNSLWEWIAAIGRFFLWVVSMFVLLPTSTYDLPIAVVIVSSVITVIFLVWFLPSFTKGLKNQQQDSGKSLAIEALAEYLLATIALFLVLTYGIGIDVTLASRFQFVYFPAVIILLGASLGTIWQFNLKTNKFLVTSGKQIAIAFLIIELISGLVASNNLGYLQNHRPDLLIYTLKNNSNLPTILATTHKHHGQTGRMMGLAWDLRKRSNSHNWKFFLAHQNPDNKSYTNSVKILERNLNNLPRPFNIWLVNFRANINLESQNCSLVSKHKKTVGQYKYKLYHCK